MAIISDMLCLMNGPDASPEMCYVKFLKMGDFMSPDSEGPPTEEQV